MVVEALVILEQALARSMPSYAEGWPLSSVQDMKAQHSCANPARNSLAQVGENLLRGTPFRKQGGLGNHRISSVLLFRAAGFRIVPDSLDPGSETA